MFPQYPKGLEEKQILALRKIVVKDLEEAGVNIKDIAKVLFTTRTTIYAIKKAKVLPIKLTLDKRLHT